MPWVDIEEIRSAAAIFRSLPGHAAPVDFATKVRGWLGGDDD
jgi:hypothetical protein